MKSFKKIAILLCVVAGIVAFWLIPGINKATDVKYTRLYEDTDARVVAMDSNHIKLKKLPRQPAVVVIPKIHYKRESISSNAKIKHIKPAMFSRAMQFEPVKEIEIVDSLNQLIIKDSAKIIHQ
ncbi:MAG TPA: hypothetical protein VL443_01950 [Cyclobacteriaceae bacterium]|nr:hypothetical protein [Cyclobacteriaceae bacterium]